jgi:hypothetical protein
VSARPVGLLGITRPPRMDLLEASTMEMPAERVVIVSPLIRGGARVPERLLDGCQDAPVTAYAERRGRRLFPPGVHVLAVQRTRLTTVACQVGR